MSNYKKYSKRPNKKEKDKINIAIFYHDQPPFNLRLKAIFDFISVDEKYNFYIIHQNDYNKLKEDISNDLIIFDYVILQRVYFDFEIAEKLVKNDKLTVIYEIDDDLLHMDESNPGHTYYWKIKDKLEHIISNADLVTVTTPNLMKRLLYLNDNIIVIPNRLIDAWFDYKKPINSRNSIKIGYMGSINHPWDLILIEKAIINVKDYFSKKNIDVIFELIGGTVESLDYASQIEVPKEYTNYFKFIGWFKENSDWDIAIAPLEDSNLNYSKSELKYLEYAALGIPGIYSNIGPYAKSVTHMKTGLLVYENTLQEWQKAMISLIEDKNLQKTIITNSYNDIKDNYLIKQSVDVWINIFENNLI